MASLLDGILGGGLNTNRSTLGGGGLFGGGIGGGLGSDIFGGSDFSSFFNTGANSGSGDFLSSILGGIGGGIGTSARSSGSLFGNSGSGDIISALLGGLGGGIGSAAGGNPLMSIFSSLLSDDGGNAFAEEGGTTGTAKKSFATNAKAPSAKADATANADISTNLVEQDGTDAGGSTQGDPHFFGAEGDYFDFQGDALSGDQRSYYEFLSDSNVLSNIELKDYGANAGATVIDEIGWEIGTEESGKVRVNFDTAGNAQLTDLNGKVLETLEPGEKASWDSGLVDEKGNHVAATVEMKTNAQGQKQLVVNTGEYKFTVDIVPHDGHASYLNVGVAITTLGVKSDGVLAHGLWGQTANFDGAKLTGTDQQGGGAIEGTGNDYKLASLFDRSAKFSRYGKVAEKPEDVVFGFGAGKSGKSV